MNIGTTVYEIGGLGQNVRTWTIDDFIRGDSANPYWWVVMTSGQYRAIVKEADLQARLDETKPRTSPLDTTDAGRWRRFDPRKRGQGIVPAEPQTDFDQFDRALSPRKVADLDWSRTRDLTTVNDFLDHPALVSHDLGGTNIPVAIFTARSPYDGSIVGTVVLKKPSARALDDWTDGGPHQGGDGSRIEVARLATRADRPMNSASWMLARAARWADQQGFDVIQAYAGMADNRGTCYDAAGFDVQATDAEADGAAWNSANDRDGRVVVQDGGSWTRRRWERDL